LKEEEMPKMARVKKSYSRGRGYGENNDDIVFIRKESTESIEISQIFDIRIQDKLSGNEPSVNDLR